MPLSYEDALEVSVGLIASALVSVYLRGKWRKFSVRPLLSMCLYFSDECSTKFIDVVLTIAGELGFPR